jgi:hypothetical protein
VRDSIVLAISVLGLTVGCNRGESKSEPAPVSSPVQKQAAPSASSGSPTIRVAEPTHVELIEAGEEPRKPIRYELPAGAAESVIVSIDNDVTVELNGRKAPAQQTPAVQMTFVFSVLDVLPSGNARVQRAVRGVSFASADDSVQSKTALDQVTQGLTGLVVTQTFSPRGIIVDAALDLGSVKDPALRPLMETMQTSFGQMGAPFPEEPVGVGAKWRVASEIKVSERNLLDQTTTFALLERTERGGKLEVRIEQSAKPGAFELPQAGGGKVDLVRMHASGTGTIEFDRTSPATFGNLDMSSDVEMKNGQLGAARVMRTLSKMRVAMRRAPSAR